MNLHGLHWPPAYPVLRLTPQREPLPSALVAGGVLFVHPFREAHAADSHCVGVSVGVHDQAAVFLNL